MQIVTWEADPNFPKRVKFNFWDYEYDDATVARDGAIKWCREHKIFFWSDSFNTIRFTNERDMILFLLRWQ